MMTIKLLKIPVADVQTAAPFYRDVLGLDEQFIVPEYGWAQFKAENLALALYEPNKGGGVAEAGGSDHVHFHTSDAEGFKKRLASARVDAILHNGNDGTTFYEIKDPDGNAFKVFI